MNKVHDELIKADKVVPKDGMGHRLKHDYIVLLVTNWRSDIVLWYVRKFK